MKKKIAVTILSAGLLGGMVADSPVRAAEPSEALKLAQQLNQAFVEVAESVSKSVVVVRVASKPRAHGGVGSPFFDQLPEDIDHIQPILEAAMSRVPVLAQTGIKMFFNGPESFTPDDRYHLGETAELGNLFIAAGFNSIGIQSAGGVGKVLAQWMKDGLPPQDLWDVDIRRNQKFQGNRQYLHDRVTEGLGLLYAMHWPYRQFATARGVRKSVLHDRLAKKNACFGEIAGWERPNFYAADKASATYQYSWFRQNWFNYSAEEHHAVRNNLGLFDQSSFAKFLIQGSDAEQVLNHICANNVAVPPGKIVYTQWLNTRGGIEADLTVTRLEMNEYLVVTAGATQVRDFQWLTHHIPSDARVVATDVTSSMTVIGIMGPQSRAFLQSLAPNDMSNEDFPFGTSREIEIAYSFVRASRITYVGELGWELYIPTEQALGVYDSLVKAGEAFGLRHIGMHAMNSLRIEKAYRHWGHDITDEDTPLEAGLGFAVDMKKACGFIGKEALLKIKVQKPKKKLTILSLKENKPGFPLLLHDEPILSDGKIIGRTTSGNYSFNFKKNMAFGYVSSEQNLNGKDIEIEVEKTKYKAIIESKPLHDPDNRIIKN